MLLVNDVLAFVIKILALYLWGKFAYFFSENQLLSWGLAILAVLIVSVILGQFFAPSASNPLSGLVRWLLEFMILFMPFVFNFNKNWRLLLVVAIVIGTNLFIQAQYGRANL